MPLMPSTRFVYESWLTRPNLKASPELFIQIIPDKDKVPFISWFWYQCIKADLINNLGTIAKSELNHSWKPFKVELISAWLVQFGVGFYSAYLVADKVQVITKSTTMMNNTCEESTGVIYHYTWWKPPLGRGTHSPFHEGWSTNILKKSVSAKLLIKHSNSSTIPSICCSLRKLKGGWNWRRRRIKDNEESKVEEVEDEDSADKKKKATKTVKELENTDEVLNKTKPLWTRNPEEITEEEYFPSIQGPHQWLGRAFASQAFLCWRSNWIPCHPFHPQACFRSLLKPRRSVTTSNCTFVVSSSWTIVKNWFPEMAQLR